MIKDAMERALALSHQDSYIVQAPAGSGKTELLTQRFLKLLSIARKSPEEIMAVTFTRKAASEMRHRIIAALKKAKMEAEPLSLHEKTTWSLARAVLERDEALNWHLLQNPNRLRILTIDSLCGYIVNKSPVLSQMGLMGEITEDPRKEYEEAIGSLLKETTLHDSWGNSLENLLVHCDNNINILFNLLLSLLCSRDQWLPYLGQVQKHKTVLGEYLNSTIRSVIVEHLTQLKEALSQNKTMLSTLLSNLQLAATCCQEQGISNGLGVWQNLNDLPDVNPEALSHWEGLCTLLLTQQNTWRKSFNANLGFLSPQDTKDKDLKAERKNRKEEMLTLISFLENQPGILQMFEEVRHLPNYPLSEQQLAILVDISNILPVLVAHLHLIFQQKGKVDFIEIALRALDALGEDLTPSDLALRFDNELHHLLIDEYQDTSITQYRLFTKLIQGFEPHSGKTLFLVGDPMQSIYRFRGAEVSLFLHTQKHGLGNIALKPLTLSVNFRSRSPLIHWVNKTFFDIFPKQAEENMGAVSYSPSESFDESKREKSTFIHTNLVNKELLNIINEIIQTQQKVEKSTSIAVLVRSKKHLFPLIQLLKEQKIPFVAHEMELLANRSHVIDLISLLRATEDLTDSIAWFSILRAPWLGLTLKDLNSIASHNNNGIIWETLQKGKTLDLLEHEIQSRVARFVTIMQHWFLHQKRQKLTHWLRSLWIAIGGPISYEKDFSLEDIERVLALIENSENEKGIDLPFLEEKVNETLCDICVEEKPSQNFQLELMTIHKAKGLEFDYVFMPYLDKRTRPQEDALLLWLEKQHLKGIDLLVAPRRAQKEEIDPLYRYIARIHKQKDKHELARLLYVGATRAKKELHLMLSVEKNEKGEFKTPASGSMASLLWEPLQNEIKAQFNASETDLKNTTFLPKPGLKRLKYNWQLPDILQSMIDSDLNRALTLDKNHPEIEESLYRYAGIIFHRFMQYREGLPHQNAIKLALKRLGLYGEALETAFQLVSEALMNVLSDPIADWLFSPSHQDKRTEWPISVKSQDKIAQYIIDYAFIDEHNVRWIIDYKLTTELQIDKYKPQLTNYYRALCALENRTVKVGLYFPLLKIWKELTMEEFCYG